MKVRYHLVRNASMYSSFCTSVLPNSFSVCLVTLDVCNYLTDIALASLQLRKIEGYRLFLPGLVDFYMLTLKLNCSLTNLIVRYVLSR